MRAPWPWPRIIAHRGGGALAPENTLAAIRKAAEMGFGGVEFDVMLSADAVPVVIHDETLERIESTFWRGSGEGSPFPRGPDVAIRQQVPDVGRLVGAKGDDWRHQGAATAASVPRW